MGMPAGDFVSGYVKTAVANASLVPIVLYRRDGSVRTLSAGESLVIGSAVIVNGDTAQNVLIVQDINGNGSVDAGEVITGGDFAINGGANPLFFPDGFWLANGVVPAVSTSAAKTITVSLLGCIVRS